MKPKRVRGNALGLALIGAALAALAGLVAAGSLLRGAPTDPQTLCRTDAPLAAHTIVLVDATDRLEPRHRRKLRAVLIQERERLARYDRLTVMKLNPRRPQEPAILFSKCLPTPPDQATPLFESARATRERWETDFAAALERALRSAQAGASARASPILAGLRAVAAAPDFGPEIARRRLVLVSDLLEHDARGVSFYGADADFAGWRAAVTYGPPDLTGVAVRIIPMDRPEHAARQGAALQRFWPTYFEQAAAAEVAFDPIP